MRKMEMLLVICDKEGEMGDNNTSLLLCTTTLPTSQSYLRNVRENTDFSMKNDHFFYTDTFILYVIEEEYKYLFLNIFHIFFFSFPHTHCNHITFIIRFEYKILF